MIIHLGRCRFLSFVFNITQLTHRALDSIAQVSNQLLKVLPLIILLLLRIIDKCIQLWKPIKHLVVCSLQLLVGVDFLCSVSDVVELMASFGDLFRQFEMILRLTIVHVYFVNLVFEKIVDQIHWVCCSCLPTSSVFSTVDVLTWVALASILVICVN